MKDSLFTFVRRLQDLPITQERYFPPLMAGVVAALWLAIVGLLAVATGDRLDDAARAKARYGKVSVLVEEIQSLKSIHVGELISMSPMAAVQQISRDLGLERNLSSIRPSITAGNQEGVQLIFESLDLGQLLDLLSSLHSRGGLATLSCTLTHRLDTPGRADLQLILTR